MSTFLNSSAAMYLGCTKQYAPKRSIFSFYLLATFRFWDQLTELTRWGRDARGARCAVARTTKHLGLEVVVNFTVFQPLVHVHVHAVAQLQVNLWLCLQDAALHAIGKCGRHLGGANGSVNADGRHLGKNLKFGGPQWVCKVENGLDNRVDGVAVLCGQRGCVRNSSLLNGQRGKDKGLARHDSFCFMLYNFSLPPFTDFCAVQVAKYPFQRKSHSQQT